MAPQCFHFAPNIHPDEQWRPQGGEWGGLWPPLANTMGGRHYCLRHSDFYASVTVMVSCETRQPKASIDTNHVSIVCREEG